MPKPKRENVLKIRLSDSELAALDERCGTKTRASFARECLLGESVKTTSVQVADPALVTGLARIGNNLNQLARVANRTENLPFLVELQNIKTELQKLL